MGRDSAGGLKDRFPPRGRLGALVAGGRNVGDGLEAGTQINSSGGLGSGNGEGSG